MIELSAGSRSGEWLRTFFFSLLHFFSFFFFFTSSFLEIPTVFTYIVVISFKNNGGVSSSVSNDYHNTKLSTFKMGKLILIEESLNRLLYSYRHLQRVSSLTGGFPAGYYVILPNLATRSLT